MNDKKTDPPYSGMTLGDIYFVLFRRKWLILGFSLAGILAALAVCFIDPPQYKSEAELALTVFEPGGNTINTEVQILQSLDLAQQVVQTLTPETILAGVENGADTNATAFFVKRALALAQQAVQALTPETIPAGAESGADTNAAAFFVKQSLKVEAVPGSSVIHITFHHADKNVVQPALSKIIEGYLVKHFKMWGGGSMSADSLTHEPARLASNVSIIQSPTPPLKDWPKKTVKAMGLLAAGGLLAGLLLAFFKERILDHSVKRPSEIVTKLGLPLFISIPDAQRNGYRKYARRLGRRRLELDRAAGKGTGKTTPPGAGIASWDREHPLRQFYEGLRDRLIAYFEARHAVHKPKLLAVTSCGHGAGVSSIAAGLAATLSETGDGNVLLVNINGNRGAAQEFYKGEPGCSLEEVLETGKKCALVKVSLYPVARPANGDELSTNLPRKLSALMPRLKASEYNYIIFDMPPVNRTSVTVRLSGLMDMVLLVIESEKTNQDVVKDVISLLGESNPTVGTVLNKSRSYVPASLHQEFLNRV